MAFLTDKMDDFNGYIVSACNVAYSLPFLINYGDANLDADDVCLDSIMSDHIISKCKYDMFNKPKKHYNKNGREC